MAVPIENIKELRFSSDARYYRQQFQLAQDYEDRWITIIYILNGDYKTLHLIASTNDVFRMWDITLRKLYAIRQELMMGPGNEDIRLAIWEKQYWKASDELSDQKLHFDEVERLCRRLNINTSTEELMRLFKVRNNPLPQTMALWLSSERTRSVGVSLTFLTFSALSNCSRRARKSISCTGHCAPAMMGNLILASLNISCVTLRR